MELEVKCKIEETVIDILKSADMEQMTEFKVRKMASEKLDVDLSAPEYKYFVRSVVESFLLSKREKENESEDAQAAEEAEKEGLEETKKRGSKKEKENESEDAQGAEEAEEEGEEETKKGGSREFDDDGDLIICRLSNKRRVTIQEFKGKTLVSIREFYEKDGKQLPSSKGISLTTDQWAAFRKAVPAIEAAIKKLESRLN